MPAQVLHVHVSVGLHGEGSNSLCDRDQLLCKELPDFAPAKLLRKVGRRYEVVTPYGRGFVSDRMMMLMNGDPQCGG